MDLTWVGIVMMFAAVLVVVLGRALRVAFIQANVRREDIENCQERVRTLEHRMSDVLQELTELRALVERGPGRPPVREEGITTRDRKPGEPGA